MNKVKFNYETTRPELSIKLNLTMILPIMTKLWIKLYLTMKLLLQKYERSYIKL